MITRSKRTRSQGSDRDGNVLPRKVARLEDVDVGLANPSDIAQNTSMGHTFNAFDTSGTVAMIAGNYIEGDYNVGQGAGEIQDTLNLIHDEQKKRDINNWMAAPDTSPNYKAAREKHQQGTGSWFVGGSVFEEWKAHPGSVLWLHGGPGCGKTILCSSAIENVKQSCKNKGSVGYAYYFFDGTSAQSKPAAYESLIRSMIMQFSDRLDGIHPALAGLYDSEDKGRHQPLISTLEDALLKIIKSFCSSYILIDALDECTEQRRLLKWIHSIALQTSGSLHLMVTSRPEPDIKGDLRSLLNIQEIDLMSRHVSNDIRDYIDTKLSEVTRWTESQKQLVRAALLKGAGGVFRWVALLFDELERCLSTSELQERLSTLPKDLNEAYMKIIKRSPRPADVIRFLQWIIFGRQEFTAQELAEVALINFGNGGDALPFCDSSRRYSSPDDVLRACSGLVVEVKKGIIKLAHLSVKEFLLSTEIPLGPTHSIRIDEDLCHCVIAEVCLAYLLQFDKRGSITDANLKSFPLAVYASKQCVFHVRAISRRGTDFILKRFMETLAAPGMETRYVLNNWTRLRGSGQEWGIMITLGDANDLKNNDSSLYCASIIGLTPLVDQLITCGADINALGGKWGTALQAASHENHLAICQLLLEKGADVNATGGKYGTALQVASYENCLEICRLLLEQGADVNATGGQYGTALQAASYQGHLKICQLLLAQGADVNATVGECCTLLPLLSDEDHQLLREHGANAMGGHLVTALLVASSWGRLEICKLLLERGANVNAVGGKYGTALQVASRSGIRETCQLLLEQGADVNATGGHHGTALLAASFEGSLKICQLLLEHGADVNATGGRYGTALRAASCEGHLEICQLLLAQGADVNAMGGCDGTALLAAFDGGHLEICQLLLDHGADVNITGPYEGTTLQAAAASYRSDRLKVCKLLLEHGANVNVTGGDQGTALRAASYEGHLEICQLLLAQGADVNATGQVYGTALHAASDQGHLEICQLLLAQGADANASGDKFSTALQTASNEGHLEICQLLLAHGADVNATREEYDTALQAASLSGHLEICQLLLDHGADVNATSGKYGTALQAASDGGYLEICQLLLAQGADANATGEHGTALQDASFWGHLKICKLLLEYGAGVNVAGGEYSTALQAASCGGRLEICQLLLERGADVNAMGGKYGTALQAAPDGGRLEVCQLLLEHGADVNVAGGEYNTALQAASCRGHLEICQLLLERGADVNAMGGKYGTALLAALNRGHPEICTLLLEQGADVNVTGEYGTAIRVASYWGHLKTCKLLLERGANVNAVGGQSGTALQAASFEGHLEICQLLLDHGADVNITGGEHGTALNAARAQSTHHWRRKSEAVVQAMVQLLKGHGAVETEALTQSDES
ncbi:hypothetical protein HWV62_38376 [Athelia sp. TMB]|nr:hypothetical protein HWV62_38376 [Athelia sp. TMB]